MAIESINESEKMCILPTRAICPLCAHFSLMGKLAFAFHAMMILAITLTLFLLSMTVNRNTTELIKHHVETMAAETRIMEAVNRHMQISMENRAVQSEVKGLLGSWINERRRLGHEKAR